MLLELRVLNSVWWTSFWTCFNSFLLLCVSKVAVVFNSEANLNQKWFRSYSFSVSIIIKSRPESEYRLNYFLFYFWVFIQVFLCPRLNDVKWIELITMCTERYAIVEWEWKQSNEQGRRRELRIRIKTKKGQQCYELAANWLRIEKAMDKGTCKYKQIWGVFSWEEIHSKRPCVVERREEERHRERTWP